jgi:hypothetical protein
LTIPAGENETSGSGIVFQDSSEAQRSRASGTLIPHRDREHSIPHTCILLELIGPVSTILLAEHRLHEHKVPSDAPNDQLGHTAPDISLSVDVRDHERKGQGTVLNRPPEPPVENTSDGDPVGEGACEVVRPGECQRTCSLPAFIDI